MAVFFCVERVFVPPPPRREDDFLLLVFFLVIKSGLDTNTTPEQAQAESGE
jgi:hypothetical protein